MSSLAVTPATAAPAEAPLVGPRRAVAIATVLGAMTLAVLDAGMTNLALPRLAEAFGLAPAHAILVVTAYQAGLLMALLPLGALGERYGHRRIFRLSVAAFGAASAAAALAPDFLWLVTARFVQGLGGAGIMALGMALLRFTVAGDGLGRAISWNALNVALASAAAPSLGALVLAVADWRWLFAIGLPIATGALIGSWALPTSPRNGASLDLGSMGLSACMFATLIAAAQTAPTAPPLAATLLGAALLALSLLVRREAPKAAPLFPLDLLRSESFRLSAIASVCCFAGQTAGLVALPFLLQHELCQTALAAGLCLTVWPLGVAVAAAVSGRFADRWPGGWLCGVGGATLATGLAGCAVATQTAVIVPAIALAGLGFGIFQSPNNRNLFLSAPAHRSGAAGGLQGTARVTGQTAGALMVTLLFGQFALAPALTTGFAAAAALALAAGVVSLLRILTRRGSTIDGYTLRPADEPGS